MSSSANGDHVVKSMSRSAGAREHPILIGPSIPTGLIKYTDVLLRMSVMLTLRSHFDIARQFYVVYQTLLCHHYRLPAGGHPHERQRGAYHSCAGFRASEDRLQKGIYRNHATGNLTQSNGEPQRGLAASCEDVAQVGVRAVGGICQLLERNIGAGGPAKHGMWF